MQLSDLQEFDTCPYCNEGTMELKTSKYGDFLGCSEFPRCAGKRSIQKKIDPLEDEANKWLSK